MKIFKSFILALAALAAFASPAAHAQTTPTNNILLVTSGSTVAASGTATITSQAFSPNSLTGFAVVPNFALSSSGTGNVTFNFQASLDGVNWTTTYPYSFSVTATGTTPVIALYNFQTNVTGTGAATNIPYLRLAQVINANTPSTLTINSITISTSQR